MSDSLWPHGLYSPWNFPDKNTGVDSCSLLLGTFPTQGPNPGLPHCRPILYQLSPKGSPRILEWVAYPFSSESSWPRNQTVVSCIAGRFFTDWAVRKTLISSLGNKFKGNDLYILGFLRYHAANISNILVYHYFYSNLHGSNLQAKYSSNPCQWPLCS